MSKFKLAQQALKLARNWASDKYVRHNAAKILNTPEAKKRVLGNLKHHYNTEIKNIKTVYRDKTRNINADIEYLKKPVGPGADAALKREMLIDKKLLVEKALKQKSRIFEQSKRELKEIAKDRKDAVKFLDENYHHWITKNIKNTPIRMDKAARQQLKESRAAGSYSYADKTVRLKQPFMKET